MSEQTPETQKSSKTGLAIAAGVVVVLVILAIVKFSGKKDETVATTDTTAPTPNEQTTTSNATYKDGTYTATGSYNSPGGAESIKITLTLKDGAVTDAVAEPQAKGGNSKTFQNIFTQNFKTQVVGVNLNTLKLTKVSGSSFTPKGFNDAVEQIKTQAKA